MFCYKCGMEVSDNSRFCPRCGAQLLSGSADSAKSNTPLAAENRAGRNVPPSAENRAGRNVQPVAESRMENVYRNGEPVQKDKTVKKNKLLPLMILVPVLAGAAAAAFIFLNFFGKGGESSLDGQDAAEESQEILLEDVRLKLLEEMTVADVRVEDDMIRGTVEMPYYAEYMLEVYEGLTDIENDEDAYIERFQNDLNELISSDGEKKQTEVSVSLSETAEEIVGSADYLENNEPNPAQYTLSEEEMEEALKQEALIQEISSFEEQIWSGYQIPESEIIPEIVKEG